MLFRIFGNSMNPVLNNGDLVQVVALDAELKEGQIYAFTWKNSKLIHRYAGHKNGLYFFCGDNCLGIEAIKRESIIGRCPIEENRAIVALICVFNVVFVMMLRANPNAMRIKRAAIKLILGFANWKKG